MDSVSFITQKNCHNAWNFLCAALLVVMSLVSFGGIMGYGGSISALVWLLMAILTYLYTRGSTKNCTLLQIPLVVFSVVGFFFGIVMSALGFAVFHYYGMYDYLKSNLEQYGYTLTVPPQTAAVLLCAGALIVFMLSFYAFCAIKYLNTVKSCLNNIISRHGARIFSVASILVFVVTATIAVIFVISHGGITPLMANSAAFSLFAEIVMLALLLLFTGISASSFITATYAFKVFEEKMMKVETNADGTVYVPVKEENGRDPRPIPVPLPKPAESVSQSASGKPKKKFIKKADALDASDAIDGSHNEYDIL